MNENEIRIEEGFYQAVGELLNCDPCYEKREFRKRTRWNNRNPGNGRYPGHGSVRFHSSDLIHIMLYNPSVSGTYKSINEALEVIRNNV